MVQIQARMEKYEDSMGASGLSDCFIQYRTTRASVVDIVEGILVTLQEEVSNDRSLQVSPKGDTNLIV
jgi:hypothetical protein